MVVEQTATSLFKSAASRGRRYHLGHQLTRPPAAISVGCRRWMLVAVISGSFKGRTLDRFRGPGTSANTYRGGAR